MAYVPSKRSLRFLAGVVAVTVAVGLAPAAQAEPVVFDLNSVSSVLVLSAQASGFDLTPQGPDSNSTSYSGTVTLDVDDRYAPTTVQFVEAAAAAAVNGVWLPNNVFCDSAVDACDPGTNNEGDPNANGDADPGDPAPANYGLEIDLTAGNLGIAFGAQRDLVWTISSGSIPGQAGTFSGLQTFGASGQEDFNVNSNAFGDDASQDFFDPLDPDNMTDNNATFTYTVDGNTATLTLPVNLLFLDTDGDFTAYDGQFVATADLAPEPLLGDVNLDGEVNGLDVNPFVGLVTDGTFQTEADMNQDGEVNGLDVEPFVAAVVDGGGGGVQGVPEPSTLLLAGIGLLICAAAGGRHGGGKAT